MSSRHFLSFLEIALEAAVNGGNVLEEHRHTVFNNVTTKESLRDVVTSADLTAQAVITKVLQRHSAKYPIVAEEGKHQAAKRQGSYWLVDPLDGTANYLHRIPYYAVSIALVQRGEPVVGVIFNPLTRELFYGAKELGAYKNGQNLKILPADPKQSLFAATFSGKRYASSVQRQKEFLEFGRVNDATMGCLRTGSAALNLAYCAESRFGGCWGKSSKWWDVAAGLLLVQLAGGKTYWQFASKDYWCVDYRVGTFPETLDKLFHETQPR